MAATAEAWVGMPCSQLAASTWGMRTASSTAALCCTARSQGNPEAPGQAADALSSTGHFASLRGAEDLGHTAAAACGGCWLGQPCPVDRLHVAAGARALHVQETGDRHEVTQGCCLRVVAAVARASGARVCQPVLFVEVGAEVGDLLAITPDTPPLLLPPVLVAQGLELRFDLVVNIQNLRELHVPADSISLGPGGAVLPVPLQPSHGATDDGQTGLPGLPSGAPHGASLWLWVWLLMRNPQGLVDVVVFLLLMLKLPRLLDVRVLLELRFSVAR